MRTALTLSDDQISRMLAYAKARMAGIESQRTQGWTEARERWELQFDDDFSHREWNSAVFSKSNESLGLIGGGIDFIRSRLLEEIFGVSPWLGIAPRTRVGESPELEEEITRHLTWKLGPEQIDYEAHATEMITTACKLGECVSKVVHTTEVDRFERIASILVDSRTGKPVVDQTGEFVFQENGTQVGQMPGADGVAVNYVHPTGHPEIVLGTNGPFSHSTPPEKNNGRNGVSPKGGQVRSQIEFGNESALGAAAPGDKTNGSALGGTNGQQSAFNGAAQLATAAQAERYFWKEQIVSDQRVRYAGAKAIPLHFKELFIPLNAKSIQEADFIAHKSSMRLSTVLEQLGMDKEGNAVSATGTSGATAVRSESEIRRQAHSHSEIGNERVGGDSLEDGGAAYLQTMISRIKSNSAASKAASDQPNPEQGEGGLPDPLEGDPQFAYTEAYFTFDVFGDGRPVRVFFTFDYDSETPIFWDYISNVTPDGAYPFVALVMNKVAHRWYGTSWFKKYELQANLIDKLLNQIVYRNHIAANPIKFRRKEAVMQWQDDQPFDVGPETVLDLNDGFSAKDALDFAEIPELDQQTKYLLDMTVATWRTRSGISAATEGTFGGTPAENTATGTQRIVATGNTQFKPIILDVKRGLEAELRMLARCQYGYQEDEEYTFQQNDSQLVAMLTRDKVRDLDLVLELKLTNLMATERLQQSRLAANLGQKFLSVPDPFKEVFAGVYEQIFQSLQIDNADQFFKSIIKISQAAAQQQPSPKRAISEQITFKDLPEWAQIDALKELGWTIPPGVEEAARAQALAAPELNNGRNRVSPEDGQVLSQMKFRNESAAGASATRAGQQPEQNHANNFDGGGTTSSPGGTDAGDNGNPALAQHGESGGPGASGGAGEGEA